MGSFYVWKNKAYSRYFTVSKPKGIAGIGSLKKGRFRSDNWPENAECVVDSKSGGNELADNVFGTGYLLVSEKIRDLLLRYQVRKESFLQTSIVTEDGDLLNRSYFFINDIPTNAYLDIARSGIPAGSRTVKSFERLIIHRSAPISRIDNMQNVVVVGVNLVKKLREAGCTGLAFVPTEEITTPSELELSLAGKEEPDVMGRHLFASLGAAAAESAREYAGMLAMDAKNFDGLQGEALGEAIAEAGDLAWERNGEAWFERYLIDYHSDVVNEIKIDSEVEEKYRENAIDALKGFLQ